MRTRYTFALLFMMLSVLSVSCLSGGASAQSRAKTCAPEPKVALVHNDRFIEEVIRLTNIERTRQGLAPLKRQDDLCKAAAWLAEDMITANYFDHKDHLGRHIDTRIPSLGYEGYSVIGENIASGQTTPTDVVTAWMKSPGHRANLLNPDFREIGVSCVRATGGSQEHFWVQDFGSRVEVFPLIINLEAPQTTTPDVKLYVCGGQWAQKARFSNDGQNWTEWETYQPSRDWKLTAASGKQTVYVELNNGKDTKRSSASIEIIAASKPVPNSGAKKTL